MPIGQLALEEGMLSARDIFDVLRAQSESPERAVRRPGHRDGPDERATTLMRLLMIQADRKRPIAEILVWQGVLTERAGDDAKWPPTAALNRSAQNAPSRNDAGSVPV